MIFCEPLFRFNTFLVSIKYILINDTSFVRKLREEVYESLLFGVCSRNAYPFLKPLSVKRLKIKIIVAIIIICCWNVFLDVSGKRLLKFLNAVMLLFTKDDKRKLSVFTPVSVQRNICLALLRS